MNNNSLSQFKKISYFERKNCSVCGRQLTKPVIVLPDLPLTEIFVTKKPASKLGFADQTFFFCEGCQHGQLGRILDPNILYSRSGYFFRTSSSHSAKVANDVFLTFIEKVIPKSDLQVIIEFGSSDLYLLQALKHRAKKLIGVDPILKGQEKKFTKGNFKVIGDFMENVDLTSDMTGGGSLIISSHTLEHIVDPKKLLTALFSQATRQTMFVFQFPGFESLVRDRRYDEIFHQHLQYFTLNSFNTLLKEVGGELLSYELNNHHWGSLLVAFKKTVKKLPKKRWHFAHQITTEKIRLEYKIFKRQLSYLGVQLGELEKNNLYGYGAALMLPILAYYLKNDFSGFRCIIDDDPSKKNLYYINLPVKIRSTSLRDNFENATVFVTALNAMRSIVPRVLALKPKRIIFPINTI